MSEIMESAELRSKADDMMTHLFEKVNTGGGARLLGYPVSYGSTGFAYATSTLAGEDLSI